MSNLANQPDVFDILNNAGATVLRSVALGDGVTAVHWFNENGEAEYDQPGHHTFSIYLNGGEEVQRIDKSGARIGGAPGKICLLPEDHRSRWNIPQKLEMFHLYFDASKIKSTALQVLDRDPRQVELKDLTFKADPYAENILKSIIHPLDWSEKTNRLALSSAADLFLIHILQNYAETSQNLPTIKGGLPAYICKRIDEYLRANFDAAISINELAELSGYSSYHFARMFKESFALPPHQYLNKIRIEKAKEILQSGEMTLAEVALSCGYSSQAHFTANFKKATDLTPRQFQKL